jgi:hypothetical protein
MKPRRENPEQRELFGEYEVQTNFLGDWENCWTGDDGGSRTFPSRAAAQKELDEFLADVKEAVKRGDMEEEYDPNDYRIVPVGCQGCGDLESQGTRVRMSRNQWQQIGMLAKWGGRATKNETPGQKDLFFEYEVQEQDEEGNWWNFWWSKDEAGKKKPFRFATKGEAQKSLEELFQKGKDAVLRGERGIPYDPASFRVIPIPVGG